MPTVFKKTGFSRCAPGACKGAAFPTNHPIASARKHLRSAATPSSKQVPNARNTRSPGELFSNKEGFLSLTEQTRQEAHNAQDPDDFGRRQCADGFRRVRAGRYVPKAIGGKARGRPA